jgi:protein-disulfide isomerase
MAWPVLRLGRVKLSIPVGTRDHVIGDVAAAVVLVEYGDYQCPSCGYAYPIVKQLQRMFGTTLAFAFRNFPLPELHPDAWRAAETAEWAALERRFWPMHDYLFEHQDELAADELLIAAKRLDLNHRQLATAWHDHALRARVAADVAGGLSSGVSGTPTFFIDGVLYEDSWELDDLAAALRTAGAVD